MTKPSSDTREAAMQVAVSYIADAGGGQGDQLTARAVVAALASAGLLDPDARLREAVAALRAKADPWGGVPMLEPELGAVYAALDAVPAEPGEQLAARLTDRMRARAETESGEAYVRWDVEHEFGGVTYVTADLSTEAMTHTRTGLEATSGVTNVRVRDRMRARDAAGSGEA